VGSRLTHLFMVASDLDAEVRLLVDVVGLELLVREDHYVRVGGNGGFHIGMEQGRPTVGDDVEITIEVDDVDAAYQRLVQAGVEVEGPPQEQDWGARHVWFRDVDGRRMSLSRSRLPREVIEMSDMHDHPAVEHGHEHMHVTHYHRPEEDVSHLVASHTHGHNHPAVSHDHEPHEDADKEHLREAHIHDHARPDESPA
jgi:catechol 2,3-dioxygenase-like lactoylglutathione lyase family enzyme